MYFSRGMTAARPGGRKFSNASERTARVESAVCTKQRTKSSATDVIAGSIAPESSRPPEVPSNLMRLKRYLESTLIVGFALSQSASKSELTMVCDCYSVRLRRRSFAVRISAVLVAQNSDGGAR